MQQDQCCFRRRKKEGTLVVDLNNNSANCNLPNSKPNWNRKIERFEPFPDEEEIDLWRSLTWKLIRLNLSDKEKPNLDHLKSLSKNLCHFKASSVQCVIQWDSFMEPFTNNPMERQKSVPSFCRSSATPLHCTGRLKGKFYICEL